MSQPEPRNPFYFLLLVASLVFVAIALGYGVVPVLEEKAINAGQVPPPSPFRDALREDGWKWLLYALVAMVIFGVLSMGLDRLRSLKKERTEATIPSSQQTHPSGESTGGDSHALDSTAGRRTPESHQLPHP
jgi:hypothetical protein